MSKFSDVILAKYNKKQDEKLRKKKNKEMLMAIESGQQIPLNPQVNVDQFLINTSSSNFAQD